MASDTQKYFVLKLKRGLISDGWFARCRNTNYLGEMMLYSSYAILSQDIVSFCILIYVWTLLFGRNIMKKEQSFAKKEGWSEYQMNSNLIFPCLTTTSSKSSNNKKK